MRIYDENYSKETVLTLGRNSILLRIRRVFKNTRLESHSKETVLTLRKPFVLLRV